MKFREISLREISVGDFLQPIVGCVAHFFVLAASAREGCDLSHSHVVGGLSDSLDALDAIVLLRRVEEGDRVDVNGARVPGEGECALAFGRAEVTCPPCFLGFLASL